VARYPEPLPISFSFPSREVKVLSTRGVPRKAIKAGQNFCHRKVVKWVLVWIFCGRDDISVCRHSSRKTTVLPFLLLLKQDFLGITLTLNGSLIL